MLETPKADIATAWLEKASANAAKAEKICQMFYAETKAELVSVLRNICNGKSAAKLLSNEEGSTSIMQISL